MPKISVLMGIYNCAATLRESVACIQNQTYKDWELILCDDGSTDDTYEVAQNIALKDARIIVLKNEKNVGLAMTLNHCLSVAKGEYLARMDGDDTCPNDRFEAELNFLEQHPEYALVSGWMECYDNEGVYGRIKYQETPDFQSFISGSQFCHAASMIRKSVLERLGGYCTTRETERVEDYDLWVRLYAAGYKGYNLQKVIYSMCDDRNAYHRRKLKYRINESKVSFRVFCACNMPIRKIGYCAIPIMKGLLPSGVYSILHRKNVRK